MSALVIFELLTLFQMAGSIAFLGYYVWRVDWMSSPTGRHLFVWPAASTAADLCWFLIAAARQRWLIYALFVALFVVGTIGWWRFGLLWRAHHPREQERSLP